MSLPLGASTTASPVPLQLFSAAWIREVSGGEDSALLLNCSLLVARVALSVLQVAGTAGWATARLSPVARVRLAAARLAGAAGWLGDAAAGHAKPVPAAMRALTTTLAANRRGRIAGCFTGQSSQAGFSSGRQADSGLHGPASVLRPGRPARPAPEGCPAERYGPAGPPGKASSALPQPGRNRAGQRDQDRPADERNMKPEQQARRRPSPRARAGPAARARPPQPPRAGARFATPDSGGL